MKQLTIDTIIVGVDIHKYSHTAVAQNCLGQEIDILEFDNETLAKFERWVDGLGRDVLIGLEDTWGNGYHLTTTLSKGGYNFVYINPVITSNERKKTTSREKNDYLDAKRVGKAILNRSEEALPASKIITQNRDKIREIDLLIQERRDLVKDQTKLKNQLHVLLHQHYGNGYRNNFKNIFSKKALTYFKRDLIKDTVTLSSSIIRRIKRLENIQDQVQDIDKTLNILSKEIPEIRKLTTISGCGIINACKIISEIKSINRFPNSNHLARYAGIAPIDKSSGRTKRVITNPGGNRKLNNVIHAIALSQIGNRGCGYGKEYYQRKIKEGKTKLWSLRCLKRQIIKSVYKVLVEE